MKRLRQLVFASFCGLAAAAPACAETMTLPVPAHTIYPGQAVEDADFVQKDFEVSDIAKANFVTTLDQLQHKQALRLLAVGKPVALASITKANDVRKGQETVAHFSADGIEIQGVLAPLKDAVAGQIVPCKNPTSGLTVDALVLADGSLSVSTK